MEGVEGGGQEEEEVQGEAQAVEQGVTLRGEGEDDDDDDDDDDGDYIDYDDDSIDDGLTSVS